MGEVSRSPTVARFRTRARRGTLRWMLLWLLRQVEALVGAICVLVISLLVIIIPIVMAIDRKPLRSSPQGFPLESACALVLMAVEAIFLCILGDNLKNGWSPFALEFALRHRRMPVVLRPLVFLWSAAHFLLGAALAFLIETELARAQTVRGSAIGITAFFVIGFTLANGFNLYGMFAMAAAGAGETQIRLAWKWRGAIDLVIALAAEVCVLLHIGFD